MRFVQYYLRCLLQASYLIGDETTGRAAWTEERGTGQEGSRPGRPEPCPQCRSSPASAPAALGELLGRPPGSGPAHTWADTSANCTLMASRAARMFSTEFA